MNNTRYMFSGKPLSRLSLGCMRFQNSQSAQAVIAECVKNGVLYLDTSPSYCYCSEEDNCETWVGSAIKGLRSKIILSAKSSVRNGGDKIGEYDPLKGLGINTADHVRKQIEQSLRRLQVDHLDCYQLWGIHSQEAFNEALCLDGWMQGVIKAKEEGLVNHIGITGHAKTEDIKQWIDTGYFEMITIPFNIVDSSRLEAIRYAEDKHTAVIIMNPLAGGLFGGPSQVIANELADLKVTSAYDMALRYIASIPNVSIMSGMTSVKEVINNIESINKPLWSFELAEVVKKRFNDILGKANHICTGCKYCMPCSRGLDIPIILKMYNYFTLLKIEATVNDMVKRYQKHKKNRPDLCVECGACESKCPNKIPVSKLMKEVMEAVRPYVS